MVANFSHISCNTKRQRNPLICLLKVFFGLRQSLTASLLLYQSLYYFLLPRPHALIVKKYLVRSKVQKAVTQIDKGQD